MKLNRRLDISKIFLLGSLYSFSFLLLAMGLGVCLIKSPADKAQDYQVMAKLSQEQSVHKSYMPSRMFVLSQNDASQVLTR